MGPKKWKLHELPHTEMVNFGTFRLASGSPIQYIKMVLLVKIELNELNLVNFSSFVVAWYLKLTNSDHPLLQGCHSESHFH